MNKHLKTTLSIVILALTVAAFTYYVVQHPATITHLRHVPIITLLAILALDAVGFLALVLITRASLYVYKKTLGVEENLLFNAYSSLINFFGPGQSGPIFRGAYLKKRHGLGIKQFVFATLLCSGFYAALSIFCMFAGTARWWQTVAVVVAGSAVCAWFIRRYKQRQHIGKEAHITPFILGAIFAATVLQVVVQVAVYGIELHNVGAHASLGQIMAYTGVANFSIFVALTPGAIGIRESFLVFSERLHHISSSNIVAANILDRGIYLVFLGLLFVLVVSLHAKKKLQVAEIEKTPMSEPDAHA